MQERIPGRPELAPSLSEKAKRIGIGVIGAGFIVRDCHLPAYADAGMNVVGLTSRTRESAVTVARERVRIASGAVAITSRS